MPLFTGATTDSSTVYNHSEAFIYKVNQASPAGIIGCIFKTTWKPDMGWSRMVSVLSPFAFPLIKLSKTRDGSIVSCYHPGPYCQRIAFTKESIIPVGFFESEAMTMIEHNDAQQSIIPYRMIKGFIAATYIWPTHRTSVFPILPFGIIILLFQIASDFNSCKIKNLSR